MPNKTYGVWGSQPQDYTVTFKLNFLIYMLRYRIIICTYNRVAFLKETIESVLSRLADCDNYELLVIDNNSTDNTREVVEEYLHLPIVRYIVEANQGLSFARNRGIKEAKHAIIAFIDDDVDIHPDYLSILDKAYKDPAIQIVGGKVLAYQTHIPDWLPVKYQYLASIFDQGDSPKFVTKLLGANHTFRREVADSVGGYNTKVGPIGDSKLGGDEDEFLYRAQQKGYQVYYEPELIVYHKIANRLNKDFILQYAYNIGVSTATIDQTHNKLRTALKVLKYASSQLLDGAFSSTDDQGAFTRSIQRAQQRGYLETIKQRG